ncbi:MAG: helix-turn-helix transcriptional regulator, partial [Brooklawnia sp.]|jgi:proteasome accessory factor C
VHLSNADYLTRPLRFTRDEALSLLVALSVINQLATGDLQQAARSAAAKLSASTGEQDPVLLAIQTGDEQLRAQLLAAIADRARLRLTYDGAARGQTTRPVVDPAAIQLRDSVAYLQAWSLDRQAWRTYRLDRIVEVTEAGELASDHGPVPELPEGWFDSSNGEVSLELTRAGRWVVEYYPVLDAEETAGGGLLVRLAVADAAWLSALLLRLGDQVVRVEPPDARATAIQAAREAIEITERVCGTLADPARDEA